MVRRMQFESKLGGAKGRGRRVVENEEKSRNGRRVEFVSLLCQRSLSSRIVLGWCQCNNMISNAYYYISNWAAASWVGSSGLSATSREPKYAASQNDQQYHDGNVCGVASSS